MAQLSLKKIDILAIIDQAIVEHGEKNLTNAVYGPTSTQGYNVSIPTIAVTGNKVSGVSQNIVTMPNTHCSYCSYCSYCNAQCKQCANCTTINCTTINCTTINCTTVEYTNYRDCSDGCMD